MNFLSPPIDILLFTILLSVTQAALAENCYQASPNLVERNQAYYDLDTVDNFSDVDQTNLDVLFNNMQGKWGGTLTTMACKGPDRAAQQVFKTATIQMQALPQSNHQIRLVAKKYHVTEGINHHEQFVLLPRSNVYDLNLKDGKQLIFSEKYRIRNVKDSSRLTEVIYDIQLDQKQLSVNRHYYTNGVLTGAEYWSLEQH